MSCGNCQDTRDSRDAAIRSMRMDLDIALRDAERANRTGLELLEANNKLQAKADRLEALLAEVRALVESFK
jgi:hypothetical protein